MRFAHRPLTNRALLFATISIICLSALAPLAYSQQCRNTDNFCSYFTVNGHRGGADLGCVRIPTSYPIINVESFADEDGWYGNEKNKSCGLNKESALPCGENVLAKGVCVNGTPAYGSPGGNTDPCDPTSAAFDPFNCDTGGPYEFALTAFGGPTIAEIAKQEAPGYYWKTAEALQGAKSLHLRARIKLSAAFLPRNVEGIYEYWEDSGKYRIHITLPPEVESSVLAVSEVAFDGFGHQAVYAGGEDLSVNLKDQRAVPMAIPNPFALTMGPINMRSSECELCELRLSDLSSIVAARTSNAPLPTSSSTMLVRPTFETSVNADGTPNRVLSTRENGKVLEESVLAGYVAAHGKPDLKMPRVLSFERSVAHKQSLRVEYLVDEFEVDQPIRREVFTLPRSGFVRIWSDDRNAFTKNNGPGCEKERGIHENSSTGNIPSRQEETR